MQLWRHFVNHLHMPSKEDPIGVHVNLLQCDHSPPDCDRILLPIARTHLNCPSLPLSLCK